MVGRPSIMASVADTMRSIFTPNGSAPQAFTAPCTSRIVLKRSNKPITSPYAPALLA